MPEEHNFKILDDDAPIIIKGEIFTEAVPEGNLTIKFPPIKQKYFIDIHPIK